VVSWWHRKTDNAAAESTLGNALNTMKSKNMIIAQRGTRGVFRLATDSFGAWIRAQGSNEGSACGKQF
jgi:hypothetical protein